MSDGRRFLMDGGEYEIWSAQQYHGESNVDQKRDIMALVKFDVTSPAKLASVLTAESVKEMGMKVGDRVQLVIKAIHVLPVKE